MPDDPETARQDAIRRGQESPARVAFPFDHAEAALRGADGISDDDRTNLYYLFYGSANDEELAGHLDGMHTTDALHLSVPNDVKRELVAAKRRAWTPKPSQPPTAVDRAINTLNDFVERYSGTAADDPSRLSPEALKFAEKHSELSKHFIDLATKGKRG